MSKLITTTQTIGPFPHEGWRWAFESASAAGEIIIHGQVLDGDGQPISDAILEAWQPGANGGPAVGLPGLYRVPSGDEGEFRFALPRPTAHGAPALYVTLFARGLLKHQFTAVFLADDPQLAQSPLLSQVPSERRATLIAQAAGPGAYHWNVRLQGPQETVFFDYE
ncbi:MAG: protocatechuate 3,4-dioxygenase [Betaproteobacteria bacterium]|nr:MAG: protocatechuate 3,4-dioxygenase [Betaproteobacteria bacterium]